MSEAPAMRKRNKKRYGGSKNKKRRGFRELEVGMEGILITCNMNERKCTSEAFSLLNEYADNLYGPENLADTEDSNTEDEGEDPDDAETALKKEVTKIRSSTEKQQRRFQALDSGAANVVFIRTQNIDPAELVHQILEDLYQTKKRKSRLILRMLPVSGTCKAFPEDMEKYLGSFLEPWFKTPNHASYQIAFKARNSSHNKREDVIKALAGLVGRLNPENKVDLTEPELTIIIEVIKTVCCVSVVRHYTLFRKYNLQEVAKTETNQKQALQEMAETGANQKQALQEMAETGANQIPPAQAEVAEAQSESDGHEKGGAVVKEGVAKGAWQSDVTEGGD
ncbi:THUMP domain-containing protein 1 [Chanos chanos]|uniref:THUMP domain-containing protein 1 n=1 Tax=Chanos chanos TaxID=29144 RepID=A0A6J2VWD5_CHACN|nr:THUMP domain-containing protein 1 [Chanos chanos]